jgi:hypothetical protein
MATGGPVFDPSGVWEAGADSFIIERLTLDGISGATSVLTWPSHSAVGPVGKEVTVEDFQAALFLVQDCVIQNFGQVAFTIGRSVYLCVVRDCYFYENHGSMFIDKDSDARIDDNLFVQARGGAAQLAVVGPDVRIAGNIFVGAPTDDTSTTTDIQIVPTSAGPGLTSADGSGFDGGYIWILDNKFGPENESLNPTRRRILARDQNLISDRGLLCAPVIIRGNFIFGPTALGIESIVRLSGKVTISFKPTSPHGMIKGATAMIGVVQVLGDPTWNGSFPATATGPHTLRYAQQGPDTTSAGGAVLLLNGSAIGLENPIIRWDVSSNIFEGYGTLIDDQQLLPGGQELPGVSAGLARFRDNMVSPVTDFGVRIFTGSGKQFTSVEAPGNVPETSWQDTPRRQESPELRNRLSHSEDFAANTWHKTPGISVLAAQSDPYGTTRACLVKRDGGAANQFLAQKFKNGQSARLYVTFWARASDSSSPSSSLIAALYDTAAAALVGERESFTLGSKWKQYRFVSNGLTPSAVYELRFYPVNHDPTPGSVTLFGAQVADYDSDYYPTGTSAAVDPASGNRFERAAVFTSVKTATHTGSSTSAPSVKEVSSGTSYKLEAGSTDMAGVVVLKVLPIELLGSAKSGTFKLTYHAGYTSPPVVVVSLLDGSSAWTTDSMTKVESSDNNNCVIAWAIPSGPKVFSDYRISYVVIGR